MGAILGGMLVIYLLCKVLEWALLKRILSSHFVMVSLSSLLIFFVIFIAWYVKKDEAYAFHPAMLVDYFLAAVILPFIRSIWHKRKKKKNIIKSTS